MLILLLALLGGIIVSAVSAQEAVRSRALSAEAEAEAACGSALTPPELIRIGLFIKEWIPEGK